VRHGSRKFDPAHRGHLDSDARRSYLDADAILGAFGLGPGAALADIGAGTGFFSIPAAKRVGPSGIVHAIDVEPAMLEDLRERVASQGLANVRILRSEEERIPLPHGSVDVAFLACVLHELEGPGTLRECARILKPNGRLAVVDWKKIEQDIGPPISHRLDEGQARAFLMRSGFTPTRTFSTGRYHYGIEARTGSA
jgi:ubiquinone/menaquinone biosynthesis C-methylase UbiE